MAINFPDSPSNDDTHTVGSQTFIYKSSIPGWQRQVSGVNLSSVAQDILPDTDSSRDLGSPTKKWKELHLSGNTIFLGDSGSISASTGGEIILPSIKVGTGDNAVKLSASATGVLQTQSVVAGVSQSVQPAGGTVQVADLAAMQAIANPSIGDMVSVVSNKTIYMYNGTGFYKIAVMVNESPTAITGVDGSYQLATDGTATTITAISSDPEGRALTWSYAISSGSLTNGGGATATVTQGTGSNSHIFTITPTTNSSYQGSFSITFNVTDNINGAVSKVSAFTLSFIVANSRYTALSVKATNTGSNQTFDDASTSNHTITVAGDTTASTFSPYRHGGYSLKFENSVADDNNIKFNNISGAGAVAASGEFCVETWVKFTVTAPPAGGASARIFASNGTASNATDNLQLFVLNSAGAVGSISIWNTAYIYQGTSGEVINDGQWHHLALTRDSSNNLRWFVDGTLITTIASNTTTFQFEETRLGKRDGGTGESCFTGEMRDTRVVIGSSVYESAFTPPTEPLTAITNTHLLVGDLPYIKDESTNNFSINAGTFSNGSNVLLPKKSPISLFDNAPYSEASHGASAYFDGTGDYLDVGSSGIANFGTGDFTIEFWINSTDANALASGASNIINPISSTGSGYWGLMFQNGKLRWNNSYNVANLWEVNASTTILNGSFNHIAVVRNSGAFSIYFNGVSQSAASGTFTDTTNYSGDTGVRIGSGNANDFVGTLSDLRIVSSAVYTSNFTPPTAPLTAITNTKFLLNPETSISDLSQSSKITCVGDAATSTTQVKFAGTKSIYLDGTGDYISIKPMSEFGQEDWTFETWVYVTSTGIYQHLFSRGVGNGTTVAALSINPNGIPSVQLWNGSSDQILSSGSAGDITINTWHHVVLTHTYTSASSSTYKIWVDGSEITSITHTGGYHWSWSTLSGTNLLLGAYGYNNALPQTGEMYLQDSRLTIGLVRYTSTFIPPTAELQG